MKIKDISSQSDAEKLVHRQIPQLPRHCLMEPAPSFGSGSHSLFLRFGLKLYLFIYFKLRVRVGYGDSKSALIYGAMGLNCSGTSHDGLNASPFPSFCPPYMILSCSSVALKAIFATTTYTNVVFNIKTTF